MNAAQTYSAVLDARLERAPGVDGLLLKEKLGGKSVISHSLDRFDDDERCTQVLVLAAPAVYDWIAHDPLTFASTKLRLLPAADSLPAAIKAARETVLVWHNAVLPNWQPGLLDSLLRAWQPGSAVVPGRALDGPLLRRGNAAGEAQAGTTATQDIFGSGKQSATALHSVAELLDQQGYCVLESPQVYDRAALLAALTAQPAMAGPANAAQVAGMALLLLPARAHNFAVNDSDSLHLMRRLLGEAKKGGKDRYGGLGW